MHFCCKFRIQNAVAAQMTSSRVGEVGGEVGAGGLQSQSS